MTDTERKKKVLEAVKYGNIIGLKNDETYESIVKKIINKAEEKGLTMLLDISASINSTKNLIDIILK